MVVNLPLLSVTIALFPLEPIAPLKSRLPIFEEVTNLPLLPVTTNKLGVLTIAPPFVMFPWSRSVLALFSYKSSKKLFKVSFLVPLFYEI